MGWLRRKIKSRFKDRRIFTRFRVQLPLKFAPMKKTQGGKAQAQATNISANGVNFICKTKLRPNTLLEIWLGSHSQLSPIYAIGKVVWAKNYGIFSPQWQIGVQLQSASLIELGRALN